MPKLQPPPPPLWPFLTALGVAALVAAAVALVAATSSGLDDPESGPPEPLPILVAVPVAADLVRAVTPEDGCLRVLHANVSVRADAVELRVIGQTTGYGCASVITYACHEVRLPAAAEGKPLVAIPRAARNVGDSDTSLARQYAAGECPKLRS